MRKKEVFPVPYFDTYVSNTSAGGGNQSFFRPEDPEKITAGRVFYKINAGGTFSYSFLFSNTVDSTFGLNPDSHQNVVLDEWNIEKLSVAVCKSVSPDGSAGTDRFFPVRFGGSYRKIVMPGEFFASDPVELTAESGDFLCVELRFKGGTIPYHHETILPVFIWNNGAWVPNCYMPLPAMVGCARQVKARIGFLGDSITQGIGTPVNSYAHWNAVLAQKLGNEYAYWNLGLGCGRSDDASSDGAWLYKAKHNDIVTVCYGVNDILQGRRAACIEKDLEEIVSRLHRAGVKVVLQTVPPFDYDEDKIPVWEQVNAYIRETLADKSDSLFDVVPILRMSEKEPHRARYGGHPGIEGCAVWADALYTHLVGAGLVGGAISAE